MSVQIVDAAGNRFTVQLPLQVVLDEDEEVPIKVGDIVSVRIDEGMDYDDAARPKPQQKSFGVVTGISIDTVYLTWMYHRSEMSRKGRERYEYYLTDHADTVPIEAIDGPPQSLPASLCPTVYSFSSKAKTTLPVETAIACIVTAHWVNSNGNKHVFEKGPGHAHHYRTEWAEWSDEEKAAATFMAKKMYSTFDAAKLAEVISVFEASF